MFFDQFSRYRALALACKAIDHTIFSPQLDGIRITKNTDSQTKTIYDIGSGPYKLLSTFLPDNHISYVDPLLDPSDEGNSKQSVFSIDIFTQFELIERQQQDITVCVDTFEHIPEHLRADFLKKIVSLSRESIVLAFPYCDTGTPKEVDNHVNTFFRNHFGEDYSWLKEHYEYGLPSASNTIAFLENEGFNVKTFYQGNCSWLKRLLPLVISLNEFNFLHEIIESGSDVFNRELSPFDICPDGYRVFIIASKKEFSIDTILEAYSQSPEKNEVILTEIENILTKQALLPSLSMLRNTKNEMISIEKKSVELGEWGQRLQSALIEVQKNYADLQQKSNEVGEWGIGLQQKLLSLEEEYTRLQKNSKEIGEWAHALQLRITELESEGTSDKK